MQQLKIMTIEIDGCMLNEKSECVVGLKLTQKLNIYVRMWRIT